MLIILVRLRSMVCVRFAGRNEEEERKVGERMETGIGMTMAATLITSLEIFYCHLGQNMVETAEILECVPQNSSDTCSIATSLDPVAV